MFTCPVYNRREQCGIPLNVMTPFSRIGRTYMDLWLSISFSNIMIIRDAVMNMTWLALWCSLSRNDKPSIEPGVVRVPYISRKITSDKHQYMYIYVCRRLGAVTQDPVSAALCVCNSMSDRARRWFFRRQEVCAQMLWLRMCLNEAWSQIYYFGCFLFTGQIWLCSHIAVVTSPRLARCVDCNNVTIDGWGYRDLAPGYAGWHVRWRSIGPWRDTSLPRLTLHSRRICFTRLNDVPVMFILWWFVVCKEQICCLQNKWKFSF